MTANAQCCVSSKADGVGGRPANILVSEYRLQRVGGSGGGGGGDVQILPRHIAAAAAAGLGRVCGVTDARRSSA